MIVSARVQTTDRDADYRERFRFAFDPEAGFRNSPGAVRTKLAQILIGLTLTCAIGGHWAILQSVGWVGMAISYSHNATLAEALAKTFDGKHPCKLCNLVSAGKKSEQKQEVEKPVVKLDFLMAAAPSFLFQPRLETDPFYFPATPSARAQLPPTPPPRTA